MDSEEEDNTDYISSYNYYIYYHSIKPRDPRLPKPTYKISPDLDFIKGGIDKTLEEKDSVIESDSEARSDSVSNDNTPKSKQNDRELTRMMDMMKLQGESENINEFNRNNFSTQETDYTSNELKEAPQSKNKKKDSDGKMKMSSIIQSPLKNLTIYTDLAMNAPTDFQSFTTPSLNQNSNSNSNPFYPSKYTGGYNYNYNHNHNYNFNYNYHNINPPLDYMGMGPYYYNMNMPPTDVNNFGYYMNSNPNMSRDDINNPNNNNNNVNTNVYNGNKMSEKEYNQNQLNYLSLQQMKPFYPGNNHKNIISMNNENKQMNNFNHNFNNSNPNSAALPDLNVLLVNILDYCRDHSGSRIVQRKFEESTEEEKNQIMEVLLPHIYSLAKDLFGNYVIQKILEYSHLSKRKTQIMRELEGKIAELTLHMYGCRVIQKSIEIVDVEDARKIFREVKHLTLKCIEDQNGNHVIQKLIERLPTEDNLEIIKIIKGRSLDIAMHQYGCRVIQKIFEYCRETDYQSIMNDILNKVLLLCQDQYGNYVIQHIIEKQGGNKIYYIWDHIRSKVFDLSIHKFASNVVEKLLTYGNHKVRIEIIEEVISKDDQYR
jgi:hypothetical protein